MPGLDAQMVTLLEAVVLLATNVLGAASSTLAWRVSDADVRAARRYEPDEDVGAAERALLRHNLVVIADDGRFGEGCRLLAHVLIAIIGVYWVMIPQPTNPQVIEGAITVRLAAILLSVILIAKTAHHVIARWRYGKPWAAHTSLRYLWPALALAWGDMRPGQGRARP